MEHVLLDHCWHYMMESICWVLSLSISGILDVIR